MCRGTIWCICIDCKGKGEVSLLHILSQGNYASQVAAFNAKVEAELHHEDESSIKWTDTNSEPPFIVGEPVSPVH